MALKAKEFAEGYVNFYYDAATGKWKAMFTQYYDGKATANYYHMRIPIPEELLAQELPNQDQIEVTE